MIAVLKYASYSSERCAVNRILAENCIEIIKSKIGMDYDRITIRISGNDELCELLEQLNTESFHGVIVLKTKS